MLNLCGNKKKILIFFKWSPHQIYSPITIYYLHSISPFCNRIIDLLEMKYAKKLLEKGFEIILNHKLCDDLVRLFVDQGMILNLNIFSAY